MTYKHFEYTDYGCDLDGTTYSTKGKRKTVVHHSGYQVMSVYKDKKIKQFRVHRFIYECVTGKAIPEHLVINHKDGNKTNNAFTNLEAVTPSENTRHAVATGLMRPMKGELNGGSFLTENTVRKIIRECILEDSNIVLGLKYGLDPKHISLIRHKKRWLHLFNEPEFINYVPKKVNPNLVRQKRSTTIPRGSTLEAYASGSGVHT